MYYLCFVLVMVMPVIMFVLGLRWRVSPPAYKTGKLVYRTEVTEKSPAVWEFAHIHCGKLWSRFGVILAVISAVLMVALKGSYQKLLLWLLCGQMAILCISILMIEILTKNLFDENGVRIDPENAN